MARSPWQFPPNYPCATFFVDESSAKESSGQFFVVAGVKTRRPGILLRNVRDTLDRYGGTSEMKFSRITRARLPLYHQVIDQLRASDAHLTACVVDATRGDIENPFKGDDADWVVHARITAKMLAGSINRKELAAAILDARSTPRGCAFDDTVRGMTNHRLKSTGLVSAVCAESESNVGLQLADLVAGAVAHQRRNPGANQNSHKAKVASRLAAAFGVGTFVDDVRAGRVNIATHGKGAPPDGRQRTTSRGGP